MTAIRLLRVSLADFGSYPSANLEFRDETGLVFLTGNNRVTPELGANGAGKSTIWAALTWCLFGASAEGGRASDFSRGTTAPAAEVELDIDGINYVITRSGPPNKVWINEAPVEDDEITSLIRMTRAQFCQSVAFGQRASYFSDLSVPERGAVLDDVLDLDIWSRLSAKSGAAESELEQECSKLKMSLANTDGKLSSLPDHTYFDRIHQEWLARQASKEKFLLDEIAQSATLLKEKEAVLEGAADDDQDAVRETSQNINIVTSEARELNDRLAILRYGVQEAEKNLRHLESQESCPSCGQPIAPSHVEKSRSDFRQYEAQVAVIVEDLCARLQTKNDTLHELRDKLTEMKIRSSQKAERQLAYNTQKSRHRKLEAELVRERDEVSPADDLRNSAIAAEQKLVGEVAALKILIEETEQIQQLARFWKQAFRRVRMSIVRDMLAHLNVDIESSAHGLGLRGWRVELKTETETKSGSIRSGVQIVITDPQGRTGAWRSWSGGETQRVRLAVEMGLADFIQRASGSFWNIEIWDEPSAWLSEEGVDDLLARFQHRAGTGKQIWIVDHRTFSHSHFSRVYVATKDADGSQIAEITEK